MNKLNKILQVTCASCGKTYLVSGKTEVLREEQRYIVVECPECKHWERVEK